MSNLTAKSRGDFAYELTQKNLRGQVRRSQGTLREDA